ncbi:molybdopterin-containing oxidoreductase family protein [Novosphingobium cyanobacteriorum]|uniref:Molybdopterin-dependent oxidoreductase n=1 Tax=Novosphingobium cyanobacteriorum TaxID=3024215 RepID=A0ABT6CLX5_9SPHN|nr:molybdopterin-dependent oxidoreductase [Novosphingobium cyanobacteriorum]MDF8334918.1 molybdopterin-dependent oxidoreductase [Novosphingobium cyanobacteriorum]
MDEERAGSTLRPAEGNRIAQSACRLCAGMCGLDVEIDPQGRAVAIRGDRRNPVSRGYACIKGLTLHEAHHSERRILRPLRRQEDGSFAEVGWAEALDDIAARLSALVRDHGPDSVGAFKGTLNYSNFLSNAMLPAFLSALGSTAYYSTMTVDQSAKWVNVERLGAWAGGKDPFVLSDVLMMIGTNPIVSLSTFNFQLQNPVKSMREARARGLKLIVIDPRRTETARHADLFIQPLPGEDPTVLAAILRIILAEGWHDPEFCERHVDGLEALRAAVEPFDEAYAAARAAVDPALLRAAAELFARPVADGAVLRRKRGTAASGTGPNMAPHSNLAEHLVEALNVVCGRYAREGDPVVNPGVVGPRQPRLAQVVPPRRGWEHDPQPAPSGFGRIFGERMSGALPDDVLTDAPNRLRAMIVAAGNPVLALPQTAAAQQAFAALDLLVVIDPFLTATARLADYVLPPRMVFERHELSGRDYEAIVTFSPFAHYTAPILSPPEGAEVEDDWAILWEIASRMGLSLSIDGEPIDMARRPDPLALMELMTRRSTIPFDVVRAAERGAVFAVPPQRVEPAVPGATGRFALAPADVIAELAEVRDEVASPVPGALRFACRRMREVQNTAYHHLPTIAQRVPFNPAFLHPDDLSARSIAPGERICISSAHGEVIAVARADPDLRPGVLAMAHGWDDLPGSGAANVNRLTSTRIGRDPINAMPVLTAFDVMVAPVEA